MIKFICLVWLLLASCAEDTFPKYTQLGGLRLLALQTGASGGAAEVAPGATVTITPWLSDYGASRTLTYEARSCLDIGLAVGAEPTCEGVPGADALQAGAVVVPSTSRTGSANTFNVTVPAALLLGRSARDQYNGVNYLVTYRLIASDGAVTSGFKRIVVSSKSPRNLNPSVTGIATSSGALTAMPSGEVDIRAVIGAGSTEAYSEKRTDGSLSSLTETLVTTFFITHGELTTFRTIGEGVAKYKPASPAAGVTPVIVAVTRDARGGVSVLLQML